MKLFVIFILFTLGFQARAAGLQVEAVPGWRKISEHPDGMIFQKEKSPQNEMIVVQSFAAQKSDAAFFEKMTAKGLTEVRRKIFDKLGLADYQVLSLRNLSPLQKNIASSQILIESSYVDYAGKGVHMIERQYVVGETFYVLSYRMNGNISDYDKVRILLDEFKPARDVATNKSSRSVAGEMSTNQAVMPAVLSFESRISAAPEKAQEEKMTAEEIALRCQDVPPERRRSAEDMGFADGLITAAGSPVDCLLGVMDNVWDILKGAYEILAGGVKIIFDQEYRSQITATIGIVAAEAYKDPAAFSSRIAAAVYNAAKKNVGEFFECLSPSAKIEAVCKMVSNLIPVGLMSKILTKAPLAAEEVARLAKIAKEAAMARGTPYVERSVSIRGVRHDKILGTGDNTLSKVANRMEEKGIDTYIKPNFENARTRASSGVNDGAPVLYFRKNILKNPDDYAGLIGHEATHAVNTSRALGQQDLGYARTVGFKTSGEVNLNPGLSVYKKYMRIDEIHARAVHSGVEIDRAEKAFKAGNVKEAKKRLDEAAEKIEEASKMQRASRALFNEAQFELSEAGPGQIVYNKKDGVLTIHVPMHTEAEAKHLKKLKKAASGPAYAAAVANSGGVKVSVEVGKGLKNSAARSRAADIMQLSTKDMDRFNKTFAANKKRLEALKQKLK